MEKISIITPTFNSAATIEDTMKSIASQTYSNVEHIIVDGGSQDNTLGLVREYDRGQQVVISEPDGGIYDAMNKGVRRATGKYIAILNSDDYYADDYVVEKMVCFMSERNLQAAWGDVLFRFRFGIKRYWKGGQYRPGKFKYGWVPPHPAFFCHRDLFDKFGGFRMDFYVAADYELMLRFIVKNGIRCDYQPMLVTMMRPGGCSGQLKSVFMANFSDILKAYKVNGLRVPWQFGLCKPFLKLIQFRF